MLPRVRRCAATLGFGVKRLGVNAYAPIRVVLYFSNQSTIQQQ